MPRVGRFSLLVKYEVHKVVSMKTSLVSIDQTIYLVDKYQYFLRTFCRDFQGR